MKFSIVIVSYNAGDGLLNTVDSCAYARNERVADITLGDFWGIWDDKHFADDYQYGVSLLQANSDKGKELYHNCLDSLAERSASKEIAYKHNLTLTRSYAHSPQRAFFFENLGKVRFDKLVKRCMNQFSGLVSPCTISDDLSGSQI